MKRASKWLYLLALAGLVGCGSDGFSMRSGHRTRTTPPPNQPLILDLDAQQELGYYVRWETPLRLERGDTISHVELLDDVVVLIEPGTRRVTALAESTGQVKWSRTIGREAAKLYRPFRIDDRVYVNTTTELFGFDVEDGTIVSKHRLQHTVRSSPVIIDNLAIFSSIDGTVFAHHVRAGFFIWQYRMTGGIVTNPALVARTVFVGDTKGSYAMLSDEGELLWRSRTFEAITGQPVATIRGIYVPSEDTNLYALDRRDGSDRWRFSAEKPLETGPVVVDGTVYQSLPTGDLVALRDQDGQELWRIDTAHTPLMSFADKLLMSDEGRLYFLDKNSGKLVGQFRTTRPVLHVRDLTKDQLLLVAKDGSVSMIKPSR